jgi:signal transduction histidine kinase
MTIRALWSRVGFAPRIAIVVILAFAGTQLLSKAMRMLIPPNDFVFFETAWLVETMVDAQKAIAAVDRQRRDAAVNALPARRWLEFAVLEQPPAAIAGPVTGAAADIKSRLDNRLGIAADDIVVDITPYGNLVSQVTTGVILLSDLPALMTNVGADLVDQYPLVASSITIAVRLDDRTWLTAKQIDGDLTVIRHLRNAADLLGAVFFVVVLSIWMARGLVKPLTRLATAAERMGRERTAAPIGSMDVPEYAMIARAFDDMQSRLERFVDERTTMLAAISHDLRTPLTRLRLMAEYMRDENQRRDVLADISEMEALIKSSLAFGSAEARKEPHSVVDIAALLISLCDTFTDMGADVTYLGSDHAQLPCQPVAMRRALSNLIDNGCRYGGAVTVSLRNGRQGITVVIQDTGPGIPTDQVERAFAPFQRLDNSRNRATGGTGLGLAIARDVIRGHGGEITLGPAHPVGLLVTINLPKPRIDAGYGILLATS